MKACIFGLFVSLCVIYYGYGHLVGLDHIKLQSAVTCLAMMLYNLGFLIQQKNDFRASIFSFLE